MERFSSDPPGSPYAATKINVVSVPLWAFPMRDGDAQMEIECVRSQTRTTVIPSRLPQIATTAVFAWILGAGCGLSPRNANSGSTPTDPNDGVQPFTSQLTIARHIDQPLSEQRVNRVFSTANALLQGVDNNCPDVACPVTFERSQAIATFDDSPAIVTTEEQLDLVFANPADIKIVTLMVGVCGSPAANDVSLVLGCASTGGTAVLVQDAPPDVWAHEWGHVQGLPHRDDCARNLMHAFELETNAVDATERDAFLSPVPGQNFLAFKAIAKEQPVESQQDNDKAPQLVGETPSLEDLMSRRYLAGFPSALFDRHELNLQSRNLLEQMKGESSPRSRANIARALGLSHDLAACESFLASCGSIAGELNIDEVDELIERIIALGRLASVDGTNETTEFLLAGSDPSFWQNRNLELRLEDGQRINLENALARICVLGLGLSTDPEASNRLRELRQKATTTPRTDPWFIPQINEALARIEGTGKFAKGAKSHRIP